MSLELVALLDCLAASNQLQHCFFFFFFFFTLSIQPKFLTFITQSYFVANCFSKFAMI
jgi:hypothetical protein